MQTLSLVVPCYNEEEVLPLTAETLSAVITKLVAMELVSSDSRIYFIDDGSRDRTWEIIEKLHQSSPIYCGLKLSRNSGHQNALLAGLLAVPGDMTISIDADLQDDVNVIEEMVRKYHAGSDIVYGVRVDRKTDSFFKRWTATAFYTLLEKMGAEIVSNHADFRLLSRRVVTALANYSEVNLFVRGIIPQLGFTSSSVFYARASRPVGKSKYPLGKMLALALNGVTSFSIRPLRFITVMGITVSFLSVIMGLWGLGIKLFTDQALPGWASTVTPMYFLGGIQLLSLGIIGEYLGKIYLETKRRPRFIIERALGETVVPDQCQHPDK